MFSLKFTHRVTIANCLKPGINSKTTDNHAAECSKAVCWDVKLSVWDVKIVHTPIWPKVSVPLIKKTKTFLFIQEKCHTSKSFWKRHPLIIDVDEMFDVSPKRDDSSAAISFSVSNTTFVHVNDEDSAQSDPGLRWKHLYICWLYTVLFRLYPTRIVSIKRGSRGGQGVRTPPPWKSQNRVS